MFMILKNSWLLLKPSKWLHYEKVQLNKPGLCVYY